MNRSTATRAVLAGLLLSGLTAMAPPSVAAPPDHDVLPREQPASGTPGFPNGEVRAITQVGDVMVVGGTFTQVTPAGATTRSASGLVAFDADSGQLLAGFGPTLNGAVEDVLPGPDPGTVYVAGRFTQVNGTAQSHVTLLDLGTGQVVPGFRPAATNGRVETIVVARDRLLLGGAFTTAGGVQHRGLASLALRTGALDAMMGVDVSGHHNDSGSGAQGAVGVRDMETDGDGTTLAVIGNFTHADGLPRDQVMLVDLSGPSAAVDPDWRTRRYEPHCYSFAFDSYMRGLAVSPDGSYFVIGTTGGANPGTLCDSIARFEFDATGDAVQPTWVSAAGGDTLWGVEITENAVYVGGHQRWMNNPNGRDSNGQASVPRAGLSAHDPDSGVPLSWNPGRNPRGEAAYVIHATPDGLWIGSNTEWIGDYQWRRQRLAFFPLAGGVAPHPETTPGLPGGVHLAGRPGSPLSTVAFDGAVAGSPVTADPRGVPWADVRGAFVVGDTLFTAQTDGYLHRRTFTTDQAGADQRVDPYNDPEWSDVTTGSGNTYRGRVPDLYGQIGTLTGLTYSNDRIYYTRSGNSQLYWRWFNADSGIVGGETFTASGGRSWSDTGGLFVAGDTMYVVSRTSGDLLAVPFDDGPTGPAVLVDDALDWRANAVFIGPGGATPPPVDQAPTARFTLDCAGLICTADGTASSDPEGGLDTWAWSFGDGGSATGPTATHTYAAAGTWTVRLRVTDAAGATDEVTQVVTVAAAPPPGGDIGFRASSAETGNLTSPRVGVPQGVVAGDQLVLVGTYQDGGAVSDPAGWTRVASDAQRGMTSIVWTRTATGVDAGGTVTTPASARLKYALALAAYDGVDASSPVAAIASATSRGSTQHTSPVVQAPAGAWVLQAWTDKSSESSDWTAPDGTTVRQEVIGSGGGRINALLVDGGGPVGGGQVGGQTATTSGASNGVSWTVVLRPAP